MAKTTKPDAETAETAPAEADTASVEATPDPATLPADGCVVDDGTPHMGQPVHGGKVCSAHEMHYRSDGTRRVPLPTSAITSVPGPRIKR